jgi:hypothetical protein
MAPGLQASSSTEIGILSRSGMNSWQESMAKAVSVATQSSCFCLQILCSSNGLDWKHCLSLKTSMSQSRISKLNVSKGVLKVPCLKQADTFSHDCRGRSLHDHAVAGAYPKLLLYVMWAGISTMYTLIYMSAYYTVCHKNAGMRGASLGLQMMFLGLVCEIWADIHKAWSKSVNPHR